MTDIESDGAVCHSSQIDAAVEGWYYRDEGEWLGAFETEHEARAAYEAAQRGSGA